MNPTNHWKLGLFVVVGVALGFAGLALFGAQRLNRVSFPVVTYFGESVEGLDVGSPVKLRGVQLGRVSEITFAPNHRDVAVTCEIYLDTVRRLGLRDTVPDSRAELSLEFEGLRLQLVRSGITGVAFLEADIFESDRVVDVTYDFQTPWNFIPSQPSTLRSIESGLEETLSTLPRTLEEATRALSSFEQAMRDARLDVLSTEIESAAASGRALIDELRAAEPAAVLGDARGAAQEVGLLANEARSGMASLQASLDSLESLLANAERDLNQAGLDEAVGSVRDAAQRVGAMADDGSALAIELRAEVRQAGETLASLRQLLDLLERHPSALLRGRE